MEVENKELELDIEGIKTHQLLDFILDKIKCHQEKILRWAIVEVNNNKIKIEMSVLK